MVGYKTVLNWIGATCIAIGVLWIVIALLMGAETSSILTGIPFVVVGVAIFLIRKYLT